MIVAWAAIAVSGGVYYYSNVYQSEEISRLDLEVGSINLRLKHLRKKTQLASRLFASETRRHAEIKSLSKTFENRFKSFSKIASEIARSPNAVSLRKSPVLESEVGFEYQLRMWVPARMRAVLYLSRVRNQSMPEFADDMQAEEFSLHTGDHLLTIRNGNEKDGAANLLSLDVDERIVWEKFFEPGSLVPEKPLKGNEQWDCFLEDKPLLILSVQTDVGKLCLTLKAEPTSNAE